MNPICAWMPPEERAQTSVWRAQNHAARIDVNIADESTLRLIRDPIGPKRASSIVLHRQQRGPFATLGDISLHVRGISTTMIDLIRDRVCLSGYSVGHDGQNRLTHYTAVASSCR